MMGGSTLCYDIMEASLHSSQRTHVTTASSAYPMLHDAKTQNLTNIPE